MPRFDELWESEGRALYPLLLLCTAVEIGGISRNQFLQTGNLTLILATMEEGRGPESDGTHTNSSDSHFVPRTGQRRKRSIEDRELDLDKREGTWLIANAQALQRSTGVNLQRFLKSNKRQGKWRGVAQSSVQRSKDVRWTAVVHLGGADNQRRLKYHVSTVYRTVEAAAMGHDRAAIAIFGRNRAQTNFPLQNYSQEEMLRTGSSLKTYLLKLRAEASGQTAASKEAELDSLSHKGVQIKQAALRQHPRNLNPARCGECINCITQSGRICFKNASAKVKQPVLSQRPEKMRRGHFALAGAASRQRLAAMYRLQESKRIPLASITGVDGLEGQSSAPHHIFYPSGVAPPMSRLTEFCYDYVADLVKLHRMHSHCGEGEESHNLAIQGSPCQCCGSFKHKAGACQLLSIDDKSCGHKPILKGHARADTLEWMQQLPPQIMQSANEIQKASSLRNGTGGIKSSRKERRGVGPNAATAFSIIMDQLLTENAR